ncbi:hypothetical protein O6H91_Y321600 [Diphasiastrum complanatum]|nr:hypothetical protein O6H91_Y321600 [Diphasiastrum complanatum]
MKSSCNFLLSKVCNSYNKPNSNFDDILQRKQMEAKTLLGRLGTTSDIAAVVAFLASPDASYVTGENIVVSGGVTSRL